MPLLQNICPNCVSWFSAWLRTYYFSRVRSFTVFVFYFLFSKIISFRSVDCFEIWRRFGFLANTGGCWNIWRIGLRTGHMIILLYSTKIRKRIPNIRSKHYFSFISSLAAVERTWELFRGMMTWFADSQCALVSPSPLHQIPCWGCSSYPIR